MSGGFFERVRRRLAPTPDRQPSHVDLDGDGWRGPIPEGSHAAASPDAVAAWRDAVRREFAGDSRVFFLTGSARSGTTSCIRVLGLARNVSVTWEPRPRMTALVERYRHGDLHDPRPYIWRHRIEGIRSGLIGSEQYGEKDLQPYCWLPFYRDLFNPRFVMVRRDAPDAARSLLGYHHLLGRPVYAEARQGWPAEPGAPLAEPTPTERTRPRPVVGDPWYDAWPSLTRVEMIGWYWAHVMRTAQRDLQAMEPERWTEIDYTATPGIEEFERLFRFLGLSVPDEQEIRSVLDARVNSFEEKQRGRGGELPAFEAWPAEVRAAFDRVTAAARVELGFAPLSALPRDAAARDAMTTPLAAPSDALQTALLGPLLDLARSRTDGSALIVGPNQPPWAGAHTHFPAGTLADLPAGRFDFVIALGVADRAPDLDAWFRALAERTGRVLLWTASRDEASERLEHAYHFSSDGEGRHGWARTRHHALARRHLGFTRVRSGALETGEARRPRLGYLVAER